jgi:trans-aconitate 2-methyltransferase
MTDTWDPDVYARFAAERRQPFDDLLAMVQPVPGGQVVDVGCGSGELTSVLHETVGAATTVGIDSSASMLDKSQAFAALGLRFEQADLTAWAPEGPIDLVFANASLQWAGDHPGLLARYASWLTPTGQLAVQVPANFDHPTHVVADRVGQSFGVEPVDRFEAVLKPEHYAAVLDDLRFTQIDVRMQVYVHHLPSTASAIDWVAGSLLTEYRRQLDGDRYQEFLDRYRLALLDELGDPSGDQPYTHLFKRILFRAGGGRSTIER